MRYLFIMSAALWTCPLESVSQWGKEEIVRDFSPATAGQPGAVFAFSFKI